MRHRTRIALLALSAIPLLAGTSFAQRTPPPARPGEVVPPEEPPRSSTVERSPEQSGKRGEIMRRVQGSDDFTGTGRAITLGQPLRSELDRSDERASDESYYEEWTFRGRPGTRVSITMGSSAFDTYLVWGRMSDGEFMGLATDDDGGEGTDSRLDVWVRDDQEYTIRANTYTRRALGRYTLFAEEAPARPDPGAPQGDVQPGQTRRGSLGDGDALAAGGSYYELWTFRGRPGQRVRISAASDDFDTRLVWARMAGREALGVTADDDGGEGSNSELTVEVGADGEYGVIVNAMRPGQTGAYTLRVEPATR